jgi:CheY-like chemotaxis protein
MAEPRLNLKNVVGLIADRDAFTRGLIIQMLRGFGLDNLLVANTGEETKNLLANNKPDIMFIEGALPDMSSADLIDWIRRHTPNPLRFVPIIVMSGYTQLRLISQARDGGAHIVIRKPVSPQALFDRIAWVAHFSRPFLETTHFVGPDRRFHDVPPPDGKLKREGDAREEAAS